MLWAQWAACQRQREAMSSPGTAVNLHEILKAIQQGPSHLGMEASPLITYQTWQRGSWNFKSPRFKFNHPINKRGMEVNYQVSKLTAQELPSKKGHLLLCVSPWCPRSVFRESGGPIASAGCSTMAGGSPSKPGFYSRGEWRRFPMGEKQRAQARRIHVWNRTPAPISGQRHSHY